jgi:hypothetical protein
MSAVRLSHESLVLLATWLCASPTLVPNGLRGPALSSPSCRHILTINKVYNLDLAAMSTTVYP